MELGNLDISQYGIAAVFMVAAWKFYQDMRSDSTEREKNLMAHLEKQADTMQAISITLQTMDNRICNFEKKEQ